MSVSATGIPGREEAAIAVGAGLPSAAGQHLSGPPDIIAAAPGLTALLTQIGAAAGAGMP